VYAETKKLADRARQQGTPHNDTRDSLLNGILPVPSRQRLTGTVLVNPEEASERAAARYARASSAMEAKP